MTAQLIPEGERTVLQGLVAAGARISAFELSDRLGVGEERVVSILNSLAQQGLVRLEVQQFTSYILTAEGEEYARFGLPEFRLFDAVIELGRHADMDAAVAKAGLSPKTKGIGISWAKKKGLLSIAKDGKKMILEARADAPTSVLGELLEILHSGQTEIARDMEVALEQAIERKLVTSSSKHVIEAEIVDSKRELIDELLSAGLQGIGDLTPELLASGEWRQRLFKPYNVEMTPVPAFYGKKHPYAEFIDWLKEILVGLGFEEWFGPFAETEYWNNDALFVPQDHVARDVQDQFKVVQPYDHGDIIDEVYYRSVKAVHEDGGDTGSIGWDGPYSREVATRLCLRAHTTPVSMRYLWSHREPPQKMFIIDRNFRSETLSASHAQEFNQCEGIISDHDLTLRDLMGYIGEICKRIGLKKMKWKPGQFPFTEPSIEGFAKHEVLGWIEVAPGGLFRPEVTYPLGIRNSVLAWGLGAGRMYMASMDIRDIRELFTRDLSWLRRSYFVR